MVFVMARHSVTDYAKWKQAFEGAIAMRKGVTGQPDIYFLNEA